MHVAVILIGALIVLASLAGFFVSFWRQEPPKAGNSSQADWGTLTGGGFQPNHHSGSDHHAGP